MTDAEFEAATANIRACRCVRCRWCRWLVWPAAAAPRRDQWPRWRGARHTCAAGHAVQDIDGATYCVDYEQWTDEG